MPPPPESGTNAYRSRQSGVLVIPAYCESKRLPAFLQSLCPVLEGVRSEVLIQVVDDASPAAESERMTSALASMAQGRCTVAPMLRLEKNSRKGGAILAGWRHHPGHDWYAFVDGDGAVPAEEVARLVRSMEDSDAAHPTLVVAIRELGKSHRVVRSWIRAVSGRCFGWIACRVAGRKLPDFQCGLKLLNRAAWEKLDPVCRGYGFCFDVELIARAARRGVVLQPTAIDWEEKTGGSIRLPIAGPAMLLQLARLAASLRRDDVRRGSGSAELSALIAALLVSVVAVRTEAAFSQSRAVNEARAFPCSSIYTQQSSSPSFISETAVFSKEPGPPLDCASPVTP